MYSLTLKTDSHRIAKYVYTSLILVFTILFSLTSGIAQVTFVKTNGSGAGASWADAAGDLRQVLAQAQPGDEIWVAAGTYMPTSCSSCNALDKTLAFEIPKGVELYGGFSGSETLRSQRNVVANSTILSGDINNDGSINGNSYHVVSFFHADQQTRIDGFTVRDGNANGSNEGQHGGGIYNDGSGAGNTSHPIIANCRLLNNHALSNGGGLYNNGFFGAASPRILNTTFELNDSREGGAIHNQGFGGISSPEVLGCTFIANHSSAGGACYNSGNNGISNPRYEACHFKDNDCTGYGGAIYNFAKNPGAQCEAKFINCIFDNNNGDGAAGAIYTLGSSQGEARPIILGGVFHNNYSRVGGAIYVNASDNGISILDVVNSIFTSSRAGFDDLLHFSGNSGPVVNMSFTQVDASSCSAITGSQGGTLNCGLGMVFSNDAMFVDPANDDFHLSAGAPGIDAGSNAAYANEQVTVDFSGSVRVQGTFGDLGAFEFSTGDSDGDGILDINDNCPLVANAAQLDNDGDGFGEACDCNDDDENVNPNALEICDNIDNNCNNLIDESGGTTSYYADADGDGFGDAATVATFCSPPVGYVLNDSDCDDNNASVYPGAPELCDGLDNDCNDLIDDGAVDNEAPVISCRSISRTVPAGATVSISPADVYENGSDNCGSVQLISVVPSSFMLPGTYSVVLTAEDDSGNQATCSAMVTISTQTGPITYCGASSSQPWTEWVARVAFADLDNSSSKCGSTCGYSDFTSETASVSTGEDVQLTLTPGLSWGGYQPDLYWRVYIDWNQNGDFADPDDLVASSDHSFATISTVVSIPTGASLGSTRMRVVLQRDEAPSACGNFDFGEVEDYTVSVAAGGPRVQIQACPSDISLSVLPGETMASASWNSPTVSSTCMQGGATIAQVAGLQSGAMFGLGSTEIAYAASDACGGVDTCRFYVTVSAAPAVLSLDCAADQTIQLASGESSVIATWSSPSASTTCPGGATVNLVSGQASGSSFTVGSSTSIYEATDACGNLETCSINITVLPAQTSGGSYCDAEASQPWTEWIANIALSNVDNASGKCDTKCGYGDFTNLTAALTEGLSYDLALTPGISWSGHQPDFHWRAWIDWNGDGDFLDAGELVAEETPGNQAVTSSITVPVGAAGLTRMRVSAQAGAFAEPCESFVRGEVEDYGILVTPASRSSQYQGATGMGRLDARAQFVEESYAEDGLLVYPNPVSQMLTVKTEIKPSQLSLADGAGRLVAFFDPHSTRIDMTKFAPGIYTLKAVFERDLVVVKRVLVQR